MYQNNIAGFIEKYFLNAANLPFSFNYGGRKSADILAGFERTYEKKAAEYGTEHIISYMCKETGLRVTCELLEYRDFSAAEWTLYFSNEGAQNTPIVSDILALDAALPAKIRAGHPKFHPELHHYAGSTCSLNDFEPKCDYLAFGIPYEIKPVGGRSSNKNMPFFTLHTDDCGAAMAVGWPGQWAASFVRNEVVPTPVEDSVMIKIGQEATHFTIYPGERLRSPLIAVLFYSGDYYYGQNQWRKFMRAHNQPKAFGEDMKPQLSTGGGGYYPEYLKDSYADAMYTDAKTEMMLLERFSTSVCKVDNWWQDAGWYVCNDKWGNLGTWEVNTKRFPNGIREVADFGHSMGIKTILWFEPETVAFGSWLHVNKPEWFVQYKDLAFGLLRIDIDECREWITDRLKQIMLDNHVDIYREDFNNENLIYWKKLDTPDRLGIHEIKFVTAHLRIWDDLIAANNGMYIDNCASGGRRLDIESLRRSVPLLRSDFAGYPDSDQGQTYGLSFILPSYGTGTGANTEYVLRSAMLPNLAFGISVSNDTLEYGLDNEQLLKLSSLLAEWRKISPIMLNGDYYPLTQYSVAEDCYIAWQFHLDASGCGGDGKDEGVGGKGFVQAFRREKCGQIEATHRLRGLDPDKTYVVENFDGGSEKMSGKQLLEEGLRVRFEEAPKAVIFYYYEDAQ